VVTCASGWTPPPISRRCFLWPGLSTGLSPDVGDRPAFARALP
jgi:hypothetical protein